MAWRCSGKSNKALIQNLKKAGIVKSDSVLEAMLKTDRGDFVSSHPYEDSPQYIGHGATISAPHMHAYALENLSSHLTPGARALDVGSGSGYLSVAMAHMVGSKGKVFGIDHIDKLVTAAVAATKKHNVELLTTGQLSIQTVDGFDGLPDEGPFDAIHVGAAAPKLPKALVEQLKAGGRMFIPVGPEHGNQAIIQVDKAADGKTVTTKEIMGVRYVPLTSKAHQLGLAGKK